MARQESEREDLLREATALVDRIELLIPGGDHSAQHHVIIGFRSSGCGSIYFADDPSYHFNSQNRLRRAYAKDRLLKAEQGQLISMRRVRTQGEVQLQSHVLSDAKLQIFFVSLREHLKELADSLASDHYEIRGHVSAAGSSAEQFVEHIRVWLVTLDGTSIADSPHAG